MISIVISSYKDFYYRQVCEDIARTIGVPYEIIKIDNPGKFSTTQAYNMGGLQAQYEIICFIHEDIKFHTNMWGVNLLKHFDKLPEVAAIGVAGSGKKSALPTGWGSLDSNENKINMLHADETGELFKLSTFEDKAYDYVRVLDGVFIACRKSVFTEFRFDEDVKGYHMYDIDFTLRVSMKHKLAVVYDILVEHFSHGNFGDDWARATLSYHKLATKAHLFDQVPAGEKISRFSYYFFLSRQNMSLKMKLKFIENFGVNMRDFPMLIWFLFPAPGNAMLKLYRKLKKRPVKAIEVH